MYFVRSYKSGAADYDPRQNKWAEFKCDVCGNIEDVNITTNFNFDPSQVRTCPKCKSTGKNDYLIGLKAKIEKLTNDKTNIQIQIEKLITELEQKQKEFVS